MAAITSRCSRLLGRIESLRADLPLEGIDAVVAIRALLGSPPDLTVQDIGPRGRVLYLRTIVQRGRIDEVIGHLRTGVNQALGVGASPGAHVADGAVVGTCGQAVKALLAGNVLLLMAGRIGGLAVPLASWPRREPSEPTSERVVQGPHDGFIEDLDTNVALLRHRIPEPSLRWERLNVGRRSQVAGALVYVDGVIRDAMLAQVRRHLRRARPSFATDATMLDAWLAPHSGAQFPTIGKTERPDVAAAGLLEGRAVVMIEGSPVALLLPNVFVHMLHSPEDYYNQPYSALLKRALRVAGLVVSLVSSPVFVALVTVNRELVPTQLFISIAQARSGVPFGALPEILVLEVLVELIREAGLHLPGTLGQTISVVGAVVIGQSAVIAGLISAPSIVVVSVAFICSFILPSQDATLAVRFLRYPLILLAAGFGILGIAWGLALLLAYLCALESFGVPYLAPFSPLRPRGLQDALWRRPLPWLQRSFLARRPRASGDAP